MRKLNLNTARNIRASLAKVANWVLNEEVDTKTANCVVYVCNTILQSIRADEQEQRIEEIEAALEKIEKPGAF